MSKEIRALSWLRMCSFIWIIGQASGQDDWILAKFFFFFCFCVFMVRDGVEVHKVAKKEERGQYPAILTEQAWSIKDLLYDFREIFLAGYIG